MAAGWVIRKNQYYDSVYLMRVAKALSAEPGVADCAVLMATEANKDVLAQMGIQGADVLAATANDLVVAVLADDAQVVRRLLDDMDARLTSTYHAPQETVYSTVDDGIAAHPAVNLAVISVPGPYAAREARKALDQGKHAFIFSDNVPIEQEVELKQLARERRLLVMGPDCGTSLIGGIGIGFANRVRRGPVGVVGAAGTGLQEFTSLTHQAGSGISHAIGTGSHDLSDAVGGVTTLMGLDVLEADPGTEVIVLISKPAGTTTLRLLQERIRCCVKPVVGCLLGLKSSLDCGLHFSQVRTIDEAVARALSCVSVRSSFDLFRQPASHSAQIKREVDGWLPGQRYLRGLFAGGTFCFQAQQVLQDAGIPVYSNTPLDSRYRLANPEASLEHSIVDLGDDHFTQGKPHPMIDATERRKRILREAVDPEVAVLLLDFVLGAMASPDPVGDLIGPVRQAQDAFARRSARLSVVASACGTDQDTQSLARQTALLADAGVCVLPSAAQAAAFCRDLLLAGRGK